MSDFKSVLVEDARISMLTAEEVFAVNSSGAQSTYQQYTATSSSNSSLIWNVQIPSENILIDREVLIRAKCNFTLNYTGVPAGQPAFIWGQTDSFQAFPINKLFTTQQVVINNVSTSTNTKDVIDCLLRMNSKDMLQKFNSMTPSMVDDAYGMYPYGASIGANNNPVFAYNNASYDPSYIPRGAYPLDNFVIKHYVGGNLEDSSNISTGLSDTWAVEVSATFTEPFVCLSPFLNCEPGNSAGLLGINNMSFTLNVDSTLSRVFSCAQLVRGLNGLPILDGNGALQPYLKSVSPGIPDATLFSSAQLLFNFLSLQPETYGKIQTKNVVPYLDFPRFLSQQTQTSSIQPGQTIQVTSQNIQLNQISDKIIIAVRQPMSKQNAGNSASFLTIKNIQISFNNASGLLASAQPQDLYKLSSRNGNSQSFYEWGGLANNNNNETGGAVVVPTTGSMLVLDPVYDFALPSFLSNSSLGQYQFQFNVTVYNQMPYAITPEILIITINSGLFVTQTGTSQIFTGLLSKEQVLKTKAENPVPHLDSVEYKRLVGGKLSNMGMSNLYHMTDRRKKEGKADALPMSGAGSSGGSKLKKFYK